MRSLLLLPLLIACGAEGGVDRTLPLGDDAASCGGCHEEHFEAHARSGHARGISSPVFRAMLPEVEAAWGAHARSQCEGCHAPGHSNDEAIGCISCHAAVGNHAERDGMLAVDPTRPLAGPSEDPEPTFAHRSAPRPFLRSASLCGTCHELTGPRLAVEPTLSEFLASPQAARGETCADCHMPDEGSRPLSNESERSRPVSSHRFIGFDPPWGATEAEALEAASLTRDLLADALSLRVVPAAGGVEVVVTNVGAAHAVPTGASFLRDIWVDIELAEGRRVERIIELGDRPMAGTTRVALLTDADRVEARHLLPDEEVRAFVSSAAPEEVRAHLRGRAIRASVVTRLGLEDRSHEIPTHEIAAAGVE